MSHADERNLFCMHHYLNDYSLNCESKTMHDKELDNKSNLLKELDGKS